MTTCKILGGGLACSCQPDEGMPCPYESRDELVSFGMGWRAEALRLRAARPAAPEEAVQRLMWLAREAIRSAVAYEKHTVDGKYYRHQADDDFAALESAPNSAGALTANLPKCASTRHAARGIVRPKACDRRAQPRRGKSPVRSTRPEESAQDQP